MFSHRHLSTRLPGGGHRRLFLTIGAVALAGAATAYFLTTGAQDRSVLAQQEAPALGAVVGGTFPRLTLTEVSGAPLTNRSLAGKPTIVWFTAAWCVPCQVGARNGAQLDRELGANAFNVAVVFVDPSDTQKGLAGWRRKFGNPDWLVALDNPGDSIARGVQLRYLDSKYGTCQRL